MARIVRKGDLVHVPWKNGGGTTADVVISSPAVRLHREPLSNLVSSVPSYEHSGVTAG